MRTTVTNSTVLNIRRYSLINNMTYMKTEQVSVCHVLFCVVVILLLSSTENNDLKSDLLSFIEHVHHRMMSIESDIVKLD